MRHTVIFIVAISVLAVAATEFKNAGVFGSTSQTGAQRTMITIPQSLQAEHKAIHNALTEATKAPGRVGATARELAAVLGPHFEKLRTVAHEEKASVHEQFAEDLASHARSEEEVLYPAAILVGDIIRARMAPK